MSDTPKDRLRKLLATRSFRVGEFVLASGRSSPYYVDVRRTTLLPEGMALTGSVVLETLEEAGWEPEAVGGLTMGADPIAYATALRSWDAGRPIHAFTVRKEAKDHGAGGKVEGEVQAGTVVVIVEDTLTTGGSALKAVGALREVGATILGILTLVDREEGGRQALEKEGLTVQAVFTARELAKARASIQEA
ncbi:MAG: orotate phosphoribosyltransferase [Gemmatimonadota bacterium]